ncbi:V-set and immunoglobulin domain-containing protein 10-like 2 [Salvelinus alpinus]|uniref:V-set and immunoglobulin domain-containing protein 10-like 2 n=1 Tax=Salvelinus alpinus TaxID=8036 RepID=UPI0039FCD46D
MRAGVEIIDPGQVVYVNSGLDGVVGKAVILECGSTRPDVYIWGFTQPGTDAIKAVVYDFGKGPKLQKLAQSLGDLQVISGAASLSIERLPLAAEGLYTCQALYDTEQGAKLYYYYIHLRVLVPVSKPYILLSDASPAEGSLVWLRCGLENGTGSLYFLWEHETHSGLVSTISQGNSSMFNMTEVNRNHTGWYRCVARNQVNQERSDRIWLDIIFGPDIPQIDVTPYSITDRGYSAQERQTVSLLCQAQSNPPSQYVWFYNNSSAFNTTDPSKLITKLRTLGLNSSLCTRAGPRCDRISFSLLCVCVCVEAPVLLTQRSVVSVFEGSDVQLTCILQSNYPPANQIVWFNNHRQEVEALATTRKYVLRRAAAWTNLTVLETDGTTDSGQYWCSASNAVGGTEIPVTLLVKRYPMPPNVTLVRLVYSSRQRREVELEWQMEGEGEGGEGGGLTGFILDHRLEERQGKRSSFSPWKQVAVLEARERVHTLGNMTPTDTYQIRITAVNHRTLGHPSPPETPADPPFSAYPAVIGAAIGGMLIAAIATVLLFMYIIRNRNNNPRLHDMLFGMQHSRSRENINLPDDEVMGGVDGEGGATEQCPSPIPGPSMSSPRAASPVSPPLPAEDNEPVNVTITVMATG